MKNQEKIKIAIKNLMHNDDFKVFMNYYMDDSLRELVLNNDLDNQKTIDELKARQCLKQFIDSVIDSINE